MECTFTIHFSNVPHSQIFRNDIPNDLLNIKSK